jgi:4-amino-4-deoxy-L-arabinose transferase-like glycosyltransferase
MEKATLKLKSKWLMFIAWVKENPWELAFLIFILALGAFLRLYKISGYMTFLGDEGRDAIVVRRLLVNFDPILVGPGTSVGNMYLGPVYYYMMAPALFLAKFSPVGPAVQIALLGVATIFFVWYVARQWFGKIAAAVAAIFYAVSPTIILKTRSSWNPYIMPFFALLCVYGIWRVWKKRQWKWFLLVGISFAVCLQSHYMGLLLAPTIAIFWLISFVESLKLPGVKKSALVYSILGILAFIVLMSPLVIFDARHGWGNVAAMQTFFSKATDVSFNPQNAISKITPVTQNVMTRLVAGQDELVGKWVLAIISIPSLLFLITRKNLHKYESSGFLVSLVWLAIGLLGLSFYRNEMYDHYFGFLFPAPFILLGAFIQGIIYQLQLKGKLLVYIALGLLFAVNIYNNPLKAAPGRQLARTQEVAEKMIEEAKGVRFNFAVIADRNYEGAYQYFLEKENAPFVIIDPQRADETIATQLFVVCEYSPVDKCQPTSNPKAEVANFGWSKVADSWEVGGVVLFKLVHTR